jgi:Carboxypeptidase regulatory-like domain
MTLLTWARSRWVYVPVVLATIVTLWNAYVVLHASGEIAGQVVDAAGRPVAGATVLLFERGFVAHTEKTRTKTDAAGSFRFVDNQSHALQLEAEAPGLGRSDRHVVRLWFRAQDRQLRDPLRLQRRPS